MKTFLLLFTLLTLATTGCHSAHHPDYHYAPNQTPYQNGSPGNAAPMGSGTTHF